MRALLTALLLLGLSPAAAAAQAPAASWVAPADRAMASVLRLEPAGAGDADPVGLRRALGSGFVFDAAGHVLTAAHVVADADEVVAGFEDGRRYRAVVIGRDPATDVAVLRLEAAPATAPLAFAAAAPRRGEPVLALGNPMSFPFSVSSGVLSGAGRAYDPAWPVDLLQHDAAINPGSSGGPLLNAAGEVVGMNVATPREALLDIGIGLAVPAPVLRTIAARLIADGAVARGQAGLTVRAADPWIVAALGGPSEPGLLIEAVVADGPADRAGLQPGEVLLAAGGRAMAYPRDLSALLLESAPGDRIEARVWGPDGERRAPLVLGAAPPPVAPERVGEVTTAQIVKLGLRVIRPVDGGPGVVVAEIEAGSLAEASGLRRDDRVLAVNGRVPADAEAVRLALDAAGPLAVLRVRRDGHPERHILLPLDAAAADRLAAGSAFDTASGPL